MDIHKRNRERFRQLMVEKYGNSQAAIASAVELAPNYVSRILSGGKKLGVDTIAKIEDKTGQVGWFDRGPARAWDTTTIRFANWFSALPEKQRLEAMSSIVFDDMPSPAPREDLPQQPRAPAPSRKRGLMLGQGPVVKKQQRKKAA